MTEPLWFLGTLVRLKLTGEQTGGRFALWEGALPRGAAPPLHTHPQDETFYVVEGTIELTCGDDTVTASAGDFVYTPRDVPHKYAVVGDRPARVLLMFSRSGFESFFAEAGTPLDRQPAGPPDPETMQRLVDKYDLELLEPVGH